MCLCAKLANNFNVSTIAAKVYIIYDLTHTHVHRQTPTRMTMKYRVSFDETLLPQNNLQYKYLCSFQLLKFYLLFLISLVFVIALCIRHSACTTLFILKSSESNEIKLSDVTFAHIKNDRIKIKHNML